MEGREEDFIDNDEHCMHVVNSRNWKMCCGINCDECYSDKELQKIHHQNK